jgi:hypothetical protein
MSGRSARIPVSVESRKAPDVDGLRDTDTWDGYYFRDEHGRTLTLCYESGRKSPYIVCGAEVPGGRYCGHDGRREECPTHAT